MAYLGKTPSQAVRSRYYYTATGGETSLSGADDNSNVLTFTDGNYVDVSLNGVALVAGTDYNTTTTNTIGGLTALVASDVVEVIVYDTFSVFGGNMAADLNFKDNVKANFGTGNDLQIFHDGSNSIIRDAGTGSLKFQYGTSDGVVIDSSGRVGIGTTSPAGQLHVFNSSAGEQYISSSTSAIRFVSTGGENYIQSGTATTGSSPAPLIFTNVGGTNETMRIDSSGNVGIGTAAPTGKLSIASGTYNSATPLSTADDLVISGNQSLGMSFITAAAGSSNQFIVFGDSDDTDVGSIKYAHSDNSMQFSTNAAEAMRIDSSGNLLVGKLSSTSSSVGVEIRNGASGYTATFTGNDAANSVLSVMRNNGDGEFLRLRNSSGSAVGSIGVGNASSYTYIGTGDTGLMFNSGNDFIQPWNPSTNSTRTENIGLGNASSRFKDLYLSGGVYLGGTGSANHLDDYEEGNWTPSATSGITINGIRNATYTKVGRSVSVGFWINADITSTDFIIAGLPFTISGRVGGSLSNQNLKETLAVTSITTSIYAYGATTGTDDEILFFLTYDT
jgi:hypothetical protein